MIKYYREFKHVLMAKLVEEMSKYDWSDRVDYYEDHFRLYITGGNQPDIPIAHIG